MHLIFMHRYQEERWHQANQNQTHSQSIDGILLHYTHPVHAPDMMALMLSYMSAVVHQVKSS
jgi:hypothetical protein